MLRICNDFVKHGKLNLLILRTKGLRYMKHFDKGGSTTVETLQRAQENARMNIREIQFQKEQAEQEAAELERKLFEAQLAQQQKEEASEKGQETEAKIAEIAGG